MTRLRKMMLEELERRNYSEATTRCYIRAVEDFSKRFKRSPDCLGPEHIREYQAELFKKRKLSPGTVTQRLAALRFFYIKTLKKTWSIAETPYPKRAFHLSHSASFRPHTVTCRALQHSLGTTRRLSFPPLNLHRARVRRKSRAASFKSLYRKRANTPCSCRRIALRASDTTLRLHRSYGNIWRFQHPAPGIAGTSVPIVVSH